MEQDKDWADVPKWARALSRSRFMRAWAEARSKKIGPQHCDRCGQALGARIYLLVKTRFLFWTGDTTTLCQPCGEQHMAQLRQTGVLPPRA